MKDYTETTEEQWRVIWFPPDAADRTFTGSEAAVRRKAKSEEVRDWNPNLERCTVTRTAWETVT